MDPNQDWDDALADLPPGWRLGPLRFYPGTGDWQACAETFDGLGCVMGVGPDSQTAMLDLVERLGVATDATSSR
jgi:hypothetical protein